MIAYCPECFRRREHRHGRCMVCHPASETGSEAGMAFDLFAAPPTPPSNGTATSDAAAASLDPDTLRDQHKKILRALWTHLEEGCTDQELESLTKMGGSTVRPRRGELEQWGWLETRCHNGRAVTRPTQSGRSAVVWFATPRLARAVEAWQRRQRGAA